MLEVRLQNTYGVQCTSQYALRTEHGMIVSRRMSDVADRASPTGQITRLGLEG